MDMDTTATATGQYQIALPRRLLGVAAMMTEWQGSGTM
jgi:hypothetical protein